MVQQLRVDSLQDFFHLAEGLENPRPWVRIIVQNHIQKLTQTPVTVRLHTFETLLWYVIEFLGHCQFFQIHLAVLSQKHDQKRRYNIVDALHISTGRMSHVPHIQKSSHHSLNFLVSEQLRFWQCSMHIVTDELWCFFLLCILLQSRLQNVSIDHCKVVFTLSIDGLLLVVLVGGHVLEEQSPDVASVLDRDAIPGKFFEFLNINDFLVE